MKRFVDKLKIVDKPDRNDNYDYIDIDDAKDVLSDIESAIHKVLKLIRSLDIKDAIEELEILSKKLY